MQARRALVAGASKGCIDPSRKQGAQDDKVSGFEDYGARFPRARNWVSKLCSPARACANPVSKPSAVKLPRA